MPYTREQLRWCAERAYYYSAVPGIYWRVGEVYDEYFVAVDPVSGDRVCVTWDSVRGQFSQITPVIPPTAADGDVL